MYVTDMTDKELLSEIRKSNPDGTFEDVDAFRRLMVRFGATNAKTYAEAQALVLQGVDLLTIVPELMVFMDVTGNRIASC
jgi:hypothetical protein